MGAGKVHPAVRAGEAHMEVGAGRVVCLGVEELGTSVLIASVSPHWTRWRKPGSSRTFRGYCLEQVTSLWFFMLVVSY